MFLDAVWQCTRQYPWEFEFNEAYLLLLMKHSFGTRVLHPLRFYTLEDTARIIIVLVSALMTPSSIHSERLILC